MAAGQGPGPSSTPHSAPSRAGSLSNMSGSLLGDFGLPGEASAAPLGAAARAGDAAASSSRSGGSSPTAERPAATAARGGSGSWSGGGGVSSSWHEMSEAFQIYCFKIVPCRKRFAHDWWRCAFAHDGEKARRRPLGPQGSWYSPQPCPAMRRPESVCPQGDACTYSHNTFERWLHPLLFRTQLCRDGPSCARSICFFAHSPQQLRQPGANAAEAAAAVAAAATGQISAASVRVPGAAIPESSSSSSGQQQQGLPPGLATVALLPPSLQAPAIGGEESPPLVLLPDQAAMGGSAALLQQQHQQQQLQQQLAEQEQRALEEHHRRQRLLLHQQQQQQHQQLQQQQQQQQLQYQQILLTQQQQPGQLLVMPQQRLGTQQLTVLGPEPHAPASGPSIWIQQQQGPAAPPVPWQHGPLQWEIVSAGSSPPPGTAGVTIQQLMPPPTHVAAAPHVTAQHAQHTGIPEGCVLMRAEPAASGGVTLVPVVSTSGLASQSSGFLCAPMPLPAATGAAGPSVTVAAPGPGGMLPPSLLSPPAEGTPGWYSATSSLHNMHL